MNKISKLILLVVFMLVITTAKTYAQGSVSADAGGPGTTDPSYPTIGSNDNPTGGVPFDGGLSLILLAAGARLGAKKKQKQNI